jgi:Xaa-Pro aminopeptidase
LRVGAAGQAALPATLGGSRYRQVFGGGVLPNDAYTNTIEGELAVGALQGKKHPTIGWVEKSFIPVTFHDYLVSHLPGATWVDMTEQVDRLRGTKSAEEIECIKACAAMQDGCIEHLTETIRPGMRDLDVYAEAHYYCSKHGSQRGLVMVGSGPLGTPVPILPYGLQNRVIRSGDQVSVLVEVSGASGYYTELMKIFTVDAEPPQDLQEAFSVSRDCQDVIAAAMMPGADPGDLWNKGAW